MIGYKYDPYQFADFESTFLYDHIMPSTASSITLLEI